MGRSMLRVGGQIAGRNIFVTPFSTRGLDAAGGGVPDELVKLEAPAAGEFAGEYPFDQLVRFEAAPFAFGIVKHRREQHLANAIREVMLACEFARKFIIVAR